MTSGALLKKNKEKLHV